eukprot:m.42484 g.42484  ORF g.42484 m.42484 type:complete len:146 (-) comp14342_c1_seq1:55-492(-)
MKSFAAMMLLAFVAATCLSMPVSQASPKASKACAICEVVLQYVAGYIQGKNITESEFDQILDKVCMDLPASIQPECKALVTLFGNDIWKAIDGQTPPEQVCTKIDLCKNSTMSAVPVQTMKLNKVQTVQFAPMPVLHPVDINKKN